MHAAATLLLSLVAVPGGVIVHDQQAKPNPAKAIQDGLVWLARHQNPDGSWGGNSLMQRCSGKKPCYDTDAKLTDHYDEGLTGLAVLAFLRSGVLPSKPAASKPGEVNLNGDVRGGPDIVRDGLTWLEKVQKSNGSFTRTNSFVYHDAIGTLAMVEAYAATKDDVWKACAQKGLDFLQKAQRTKAVGEGLWGWQYAPREEVPKDEAHNADTSATGWAVAALGAGLAAGLDVKKESMDGALDYLDSVTVTNGTVGYDRAEGAGVKLTGPNDQFDYHSGTMSALGIWIRLLAQRAAGHPFFDLAAQRILKDLPAVSESRLSVDYYYWYYGTLALNRLEASDAAKKAKKKYGAAWNKAAIEALSALQDHTKGACSTGGWVTGDRWSYAGGPVYCTAMSILTLEAVAKK